MLGHTLITKQTGPSGRLVSKVCFFFKKKTNMNEKERRQKIEKE